MYLLAQIFRTIGAVFAINSDKSNNTKKIFIYNGIGNFFIAIQYFLLDAVTGGISNLIAILRNFIFYKYKEEVGIKELLIYFTILIMFNYSCFTGTISMIPVLTVIIYSSALYTKNPSTIKHAVLISCFMEIIYDIVFKAYVGVIISIIDIILVTISLNKLKKTSK